MRNSSARHIRLKIHTGTTENYEMSLTSFLEQNADVRARFLACFRKPDFRVKAPLLAPPLTESYGLAGTAFDYLLRFYIQKLNRCAKASGWVAEQGVALLCVGCSSSDARKANQIVNEAQNGLQEFLRSSDRRPPRQLIVAAVKLARFDVIYRIGIVDRQSLFAPVPRRLVDDLQAMIALLTPRHFKAQKRCILNPTFGSASQLVGGADGDLILDDTLIDVKTSRHLTFEREVFNQVIGYFALSCIGGVDGCSRLAIKHVGVYYARYGLLHKIPIDDCISRGELPNFLRWFTRRAGKA
jgi:hypothetical protein